MWSNQVVFGVLSRNSIIVEMTEDTFHKSTTEMLMGSTQNTPLMKN